MLTVGLAAQIFGFLVLSVLSPTWSATLSVVWVVLGQGICGVAKDLTKTASKSAIKITASQASGQLFKWVAWFTGSKNAMKGVGFFIGGLLLQTLGFSEALWLMAGLLGLVLIGVIWSLPPLLGRSQASKSTKALFAKSRAINLLSMARVFLFGARDVWFVVGVPVFLYASGWTFTMVGGLPCGVDHRLWLGASHCSVAREAQRGWSDSRGTSGPPVVFSLGMGALGVSRVGLVARRCRGMGGCCWFEPIWLFLRREFVGSFLPDFGLCRFAQDGRRCGLLLRG